MDFEWVAIALTDVTWISLAFALGVLARLVNLPPLVGFLVAGFALNYLGIASGESLEKLADLGITLLLFTVGLKLNLKVLIRPQVWSVTLLHTSSIIILFGIAIFEFLTLTFFYHPFFSFIIPILVYELIIYQTTANEANLLPNHLNYLVKTKKRTRALFILLVLFPSSFLGGVFGLPA